MVLSDLRLLGLAAWGRTQMEAAVARLNHERLEDEEFGFEQIY
jgi:hypothetical protein